MEDTCRADGRNPNQLRSFSCTSNPLHRAHGSARWAQGDTVVLAAVYGPKPGTRKGENPEKTSIEVVWKPKPRVIVNDPKLMREILANKHGPFGKQRSMAWIERLLADGLTANQGEKWVVHRRIINHAFHLDKLKRMVLAFAACCSELIRRWHDSVGSDDVEEIDVWPEFQNLTGDVISHAAFGSSFSEGRRIFQLQSEQ